MSMETSAQSSEPSIAKVASKGELEVSLENRLKALALRDKELQLREKEIALQDRHGWLAQWNTPVLAAIVAGLVGYIGTLISSSQNRRLERDKQEGVLVLEALKTQGSPAEREKQAAANLVFLLRQA